ncbi:hypothetical protein AMTR_s00011p00214070 [Amborella trichopoda]|uniref:NAD-dependent epimerase/dehydratase domain-containing protein n=1 Tax=Amborella trichopoda TaxID=13333 RepID=W1NGS0_AMBTC|nr:hypothetical protein AMTR_s00011p00214070 [Amborella trichopoda]
MGNSFLKPPEFRYRARIGTRVDPGHSGSPRPVFQPLDFKFEGVDETVRPIRLPSKRLEDLGFEFKHTMEEMLDGAINSCREKMLMPFTAMERERERE